MKKRANKSADSQMRAEYDFSRGVRGRRQLPACGPAKVVVPCFPDMESNSPSSAWLESASGERTPVRGSCVFGRAATCGVVLPDARVSREHALVHSQLPGEFWLID